MDKGVPRDHADQSYLEQELAYDEWHHGAHQNVLVDYEPPSFGEEATRETTKFTIKEASKDLLRRTWLDIDWSQVRNLGGELSQFFPDWHDLYYKTKLPHEWKGVWFRICSQFSKSSVGFMIHCRVGGSNVNLKRDSGGWITLRHAAR